MRQVYPEIIVAIFAVLSPFFLSWHIIIQLDFEKDTVFDRVAWNEGLAKYLPIPHQLYTHYVKPGKLRMLFVI
jgi:hypothetical protein